ncbi:MAG TPA: hypothetical protein VGE45_16470 [Chloroflexia bacterium]|jgi:mannose-6-phosphate isomerase-like protein (cupin superfamily)
MVAIKKATTKEAQSAEDVPDYCKIGDTVLDLQACEFYRHVLSVLAEAEVPFLLGGAYALYCYTGISRDTKDLDVFVRPGDVQAALRALSNAGYRTEMSYSVWLAKAYHDDLFADIIFGSGNGVAIVDDGWFEHASEGEVLGMKVKLCPPEEIIWSKGFVMHRERYDGADVAHLLLACGKGLDWHRSLRRFDEHWQILLNYLILFNFIYPSERGLVPTWVMDQLVARLQRELSTPPEAERVCRGMLVSHNQFKIDVAKWGFEDARAAPRGRMTPAQIEESWQNK